MPGGDRTGPRGLGAMTGRATGYCAGYVVPGYAHPVPGSGIGSGFGRGGAWGRGFFGGGRGRRNWFYATGVPGWLRFGGDAALYGYPAPYQAADPEMEKQALKLQAEALQSQMETIKKRLADIEAKTSE